MGELKGDDGFNDGDWIFPWPKPADNELLYAEAAPSIRQQIATLMPPLADIGEPYFEHLRSLALIESFQDTMVRIAENPVLTPEERNLGIFAEMLEPQVREAVMTLRKKGYQTSNSGFGPMPSQMIEIDGEVTLPPRVFERIDSHAVSLTIADGVSTLSFPMQMTDTLNTLTTVWNQIAEALPDMDRSVQPAWKTHRNDVIRGLNLAGIVDDKKIGRRKQKLFDIVEEASDIEVHFPRYSSVRNRLRDIVLQRKI
jgi:hypothetical protein